MLRISGPCKFRYEYGYAALARPYGNAGTGRTLPPQINAAMAGGRGSSQRYAMTMPGGFRGSSAL